MDRVPQDSSYVQGYTKTINCSSIATYSRSPYHLRVNQGCRGVTCNTHSLYATATKTFYIANNISNSNGIPQRHPASATPGLEILIILDLIPMDHGEKWSLVINYSLGKVCGGPVLKRYHPSGAQLSY